MKKATKKVLALLMASLMIALSLPLTMLHVAADEAEATPASIKHAKLFAKYGDGWDVHAQYGDVSKIIDGDPKPGYVDADKRSNYTYYQSDDLYDGITYYYRDSKGRLTLATADDDAKTYMGYAVFELNGVSALDDVTIWLAGDNANEWITPKTTWNMNDAYDILVSDDGKSWELLQEFAGMCGDGTNAGAGWIEQDGLGNIASITDANGYDKLGHQINLDGVETKYFAIGVKHGMNSIATDGTNKDKVRNAIVFGEVTVNGTVVTPDPVKKTPAEIYAEAADGDLLYRVNFHDTTWNDDYRNSDNWNSYVKVSEDGRTAKHLLHNPESQTFGAKNARAMWGGIVEEESFSLDNGEKYTIYFEALFGSTAYNTYAIGIQVDGDNSLIIDGHSGSYFYNWNTQKVAYSSADEDKWNYQTDRDKTDIQSFAVEVDSENETLTLYVAEKDGTYYKVREMTYNGADIKGTLSCKIYMARVNSKKTIDSSSWAEISNINIRKGLVATQEVTVDRTAEYEAAAAGDLLETINFNENYWADRFYDKNNCGAGVELSESGTTAKLTLLEGVSYNRLIYGGFKDAYKFPLREVVDIVETPVDPADPDSETETTYVYGKSYKYTLVFDLDFGNNSMKKYGIGIQVDGNHTILIDGFGMNYWYEWNTEKVAGKNESADKWNYVTDVEKSEKHTFAVEIDPENNELTLYVANADGTFNKVRTMTYEGAELARTLNPRIYMKKLSGTSDENSWVEISDIKIYKGLVTDIGDHVYSDWVEASAPTCDVDGVNERTCSHCDDVIMDYINALGHEYSEWGEPTEATCTEDGVKIRMCAVCGNEDIEKVADALGHTYGVWSDPTEATCTEDGVKTQTCETCGDVVTEIVEPAKGHSYGEWTVTDATCTADGSQTKTCATCNDVITEVIPATGHNYSDWVVTDATCTTDGYKTKTCANCGDVITEAGDPATGHNYGAWETTKDATCAEEGSKKQTCVVCGHENIEAISKTTEHTYGDWVVTKDATCTEEGAKTQTCEICGDTINGVISKAEHIYGDWVITKDATCTEAGSKEKTCTVCSGKVEETVPALGHDSDEKETIKEATCTEPGEEAIGVCSRCGVSAGTQPIPALGHDHKEEITTAPTCTADGTKTITCTRCEYSATEAIDALGHSYGEWVVTAPTCTEAGYKTKTCETCGDVVTEAGATAIGHNYGAWETTKDATCAEEGSKRQTCVNCGDEKTEVILATGKHTHGEWVETKAATCTETGLKEKTCTVCGGDKIEEAIPVIEHTYGDEWVETKAATCTENGIKEKTCTACGGAPITENIPVVEHTLGDWVVPKRATCTETGVKERTCTGCNGEKEIVVIPTIAHKHGEWVETKAATCTENGIKEKICTICNGDKKTEVIPATGHSISDWVVTKPATCTEDGTQEKKCTACDGEKETEVIPATGHTMGDWTETKAPTCTEAGVKEKKCTACGGEKLTEEIPALGHTYGEWTETKAPTVDEEGTKEKTCSTCGDKVTESIDKLPPEETEAPETEAPETEAPETTPETEPEAEKGCGGSIAMSGVALVGACAAILALKRRKNEDD